MPTRTAIARVVSLLGHTLVVLPLARLTLRDDRAPTAHSTPTWQA